MVREVMAFEIIMPPAWKPGWLKVDREGASPEVHAVIITLIAVKKIINSAKEGISGEIWKVVSPKETTEIPY